MASKSGALAVVLPDTKQLAKLPQFSEAIEKIAELDEELSMIEEGFRNIVIKDRATFNAADTLNKRRKDIIKEAKAICEPYKIPLRQWSDLVQQQFNIIKNHGEQLRSIVEPKLDIFSRKEAAEAQAEQDRIQKELNRQYKNSDEPVPEVTIIPNVRGGRTYFYAECTDKKKFLKYIIAEWKKGDEDILDYIDISTSELRKTAAEVKDSAVMAKMFPGIKAWEEKSF
jgi:hypothetical protein